MTRTILVTGGSGQVGQALAALAWPDDIELYLPRRAELDIGSEDSIRAAFARRSFAAAINPAAYTAFDAAEDDAVAAFRANAFGPAVIAEECRKAGIPIVQVSTDYVFDGSGDGFRDESAVTGPLSVYGATKLAGELAVASIQPRHVTLRTAWVISEYGSNFLKTMLRLAAERDELGVVADQFGCPTSAGDIATSIRTIVLRLLDDPDAPTGLYNLVNGGSASWYELAVEIFELSHARGGRLPKVNPLPSTAYPTRGKRPANSRLSTSKLTADYGITLQPWREALVSILDRLS